MEDLPSKVRVRTFCKQLFYNLWLTMHNSFIEQRGIININVADIVQEPESQSDIPSLDRR